MKAYQKVLIGFSAAILSGGMLYLSSPPLDYSYLIWISLVPLFIALIFTGLIAGILLSILTGIVAGAFLCIWLLEIPNMLFLSYFAIVFYYAVFIGFFGACFNIISKRTPRLRVIAAPCIWVAIEYMRSNLSFLALPWTLIGHSQHQNIAIIQIASFTSVYGVSFLIVFVNAVMAEVVLWLFSRRIRATAQQPSLSVIIYSLTVTVIIFGTIYLWGRHQVTLYESNTSDLMTISLIQGNIPQNQKWDSAFRHTIMERYRELTMQAAEEQPDMIIWPETATPGKIGADRWVDMSVKSLIEETRLPLLLGSTSHGKLEMGGRKIRREKNSAFLLDANAEVIDTYHKIRLVPFGEYLPLEGKFRWPKWLVPDHGDTLPGTEYTVFRFPKGNFGVVICWENLFPDLFRRFVRNGAEFMVNLTNEAHFGKTAAPYQMMAMSVFRAVENRVSLLRCANTGITAVVDPLGRVKGKVMDEAGNDIFVAGILTTSVPASWGMTFYTRYGDVFAIFCVLGGLLCVLIAVINPRYRTSFKKSLRL